jgi:hypothetical protein
MLLDALPVDGLVSDPVQHGADGDAPRAVPLVRDGLSSRLIVRDAPPDAPDGSTEIPTPQGKRRLASTSDVN